MFKYYHLYKRVDGEWKEIEGHMERDWIIAKAIDLCAEDIDALQKSGKRANIQQCYNDSNDGLVIRSVGSKLVRQSYKISNKAT
jgi:hypothetical protein